MDFGSGGNMKSKAWKDIWGSGQGIGGINDVAPVETVARGCWSAIIAARLTVWCSAPPEAVFRQLHA